MSWIYKTNPLEDISQFPDNTYGFVYIVTHKPSGKSYIGKKILNFTRKVKLGKKELAALQGTVGRKPKYKTVVKESDWKTYYGSHNEIKHLISEDKSHEFERTILQLCPDKKSLTYFEIKYQMVYGVLEKPDKFFNDNILGKFFTKDLTGIKFKDHLEDIK